MRKFFVIYLLMIVALCCHAFYVAPRTGIRVACLHSDSLNDRVLVLKTRNEANENSIEPLSTENERRSSEIKSEMKALSWEMRAERKALSSEMRAEMKAFSLEMKAETNARIEALSSEIRDVKKALSSEMVVRISVTNSMYLRDVLSSRPDVQTG